MGSEFLKFFAGRDIKIALGSGAEHNGLAIPRYDVSLRKGDKEESFVILGGLESKQRITPEDAFRTLFIRVQLYENNVPLLRGSDVLYREAVTRLKEFLGPDNYSDFLNLDLLR